jgi:UDPglucose--hexose-1-phosphate uridylyltransferase
VPELRKDPITSRWVIIAANRAARPNEFLAAPPRRVAKVCPFCRGQENQTPAAVATYPGIRSGRSAADWQVRVVPNLFPALTSDRRFVLEQNGLFETGPDVGIHEVIIESPHHLVSMCDQCDEEVALVLGVYRDRLIAASGRPNVVHAIVFKNVGVAAGASLEHTHSQLLALPVVPATVAEEECGAQQYYQQHDRCIYCDLIEQEQRAESRVVGRSAHFVALCPFASRFAMETWILPAEHSSHFEQTRDAQLVELAQMVRQCLLRLQVALAGVAYNFVIHSAPFDTAALGHYHWHIEILPRIANAAGFEWGTGFHINSIPPEQAARTLRTVDLSCFIPTGEDVSTRKTS